MQRLPAELVVAEAIIGERVVRLHRNYIFIFCAAAAAAINDL